MTSTERRFFHKNYRYMWAKLSTSYYQVLNDTARNKAYRIEGSDLLPSYAVCAKCGREDYAPSEKTIDKIVSFYNENIGPKVSRWTFLNEDLSEKDASRFRSGTQYDTRFVGTYYGYYESSADPAIMTAAVLKIFEKEDKIRAAMVTGIRSDDELLGEALRQLFNDTPTKGLFDEYFQTRTAENQRCYYYEGTVEITKSSVFILFRGCDEEARKLAFTLNITGFPVSAKRSYAGGLAFLLATSDSPFNTRFYQMGLINSAFGAPSLEDERVLSQFKTNLTGTDAWLSSRADRVWYELALAFAKAER